MVLRIRLSRFGKRHDPFYNIVVSQARTARDSKPLEVLGTYDPIPQPPPPGSVSRRAFKEIKLDAARARYWIGVGAQPSDSAWRLLSMVGILEPRFRVAQIKQQVVAADNPLAAVDAARKTAEAAARKAKKSAAKATVPPPEQKA
ncbi:ribosomal protein S16 [Mytilinidion resinicola]|uniref:Ribosomal protein S16 n=1 Tax=Mytilinidion resinicola TaxID=574789 RepID=A0A6A6YGW8_9PEZI|nr:ribosomal protein S16 [Mytilinidion resinicola]KAF2807265.1 ribosomal protein S16 [Mytilinidion resinicola]